MSEWIDADPTYVGSQYPLSAMATVDWIGGNLERLIDMSYWQIQAGFHEDDEGAVTVASANEWEIFTPIAQIPVNVRPDRTRFRGLKISAEVKTSAGASTSWRFYALPYFYTSLPSPDTTDGYALGYAEVKTDSSSYSWQADTISAADIEASVSAITAPEVSSSAPDTEIPRVVLAALVLAESAGTATMRALHIEEVIA